VSDLGICRARVNCPDGGWERFADRGNPLDHHGTGRLQDPVLIGEHIELASNCVQELTGLKQEIRIARAAVGFVALGKGLVNQRASFGDRID